MSDGQGSSPVESCPAAQPATSHDRTRTKTSSIQGVVVTIWRWLPTVLFLVLAIGLLAWLTWEELTVQVATHNPRSDYWEHAGVLRELMNRPFNPRNPHLEVDSPSPRYMPLYVVIALVGRAAGWSAFDAMSVTTVLNVALLVGGIYWFFRTYFRDHRAPLYALVVVFCSWYRGFNYSNVLQLRLLVEIGAYPSTAAVAFLFVTLAITTRVLRGKWSVPWLILLGVSAANVLLTHPLTAVMAFVSVGLMALTEPDVSWRRRSLVVLALLLGGLSAELWPYFSVIQTMLGGEQFEDSWIAEGAEKLVAGDVASRRHLFYRPFGLAKTVGFAFIALHGFSLMLQARRHLFVVLGAMVMLMPLVANTFVKVPLGHRYLLFFVYYLQIALVWLLLKLSAGYHDRAPVLLSTRWRKAIAGVLVYALLGAMLYRNAPSAWARVAKGTKKSRSVQICQDVTERAGADSVVLARKSVSWVIPACGPKVVVLKHPNPLVPGGRTRNARVRHVFRGKAAKAEIRELVRDYHVTHVLVRGRPQGGLRKYLKNHDSVRVGRRYRIYSVNESRPRGRRKR